MNELTELKDHGIIRISDNVVAVIAGIAAVDTEGIIAMSGGVVEGIARRVSGKQAQKGVQVTIDNDQASIDLRIIVHFGKKISHVCRQVQWNVKEAVENMTGLNVQIVNVRVEGVEFEKEKGTENH